MRLLRIFLTAVFAIAAELFGYMEVSDLFLKEHVAPVITDTLEECSVSVHASDEELLAGLTAEDNKDGDVTSSIVITGKSQLIAENTIEVSYAAFDSSNNVGTYSRNVKLTDYTSPRFTQLNPLMVSEDGHSELTDYFSVTDCVDGEISGRIKSVITDYSTYPNEPVILSVSNSLGDTISVKSMIQILTADTRQITRPYLKQYIFYVKKGQSPDIKGAIIGIWRNGSTRTFDEMEDELTRDNMTVDLSEVQLDTAGSYIAKISIVDTDGVFGDAYVSVVVED